MVMLQMRVIRYILYTATGTFEVTLTVTSKGGHSDMSQPYINCRDSNPSGN